MSKLRRLVEACNSPEQVREILETLGNGWEDYLSMYSGRYPSNYWDEDYQGEQIEVDYWSLSEEEKIKGAKGLYETN